MIVYRIDRAKRGATITGEGGLFVDGRWHSKGQKIVYTSLSLSLASLEKLVHIEPLQWPDDLYWLEIHIPDTVSRGVIHQASLPHDWTELDGICQSIGDQWLQTREACVLEVPSAVLPKESNFLINPEHPHFQRLKVIDHGAFRYDERLRRMAMSSSSHTPL